MKKLIYAVFGVALVVACSDTEKGEKMKGKEGLAGNWVIVKAEGMMADENLGTHYIFEGDKLTFSKDGFDNPAKSTITDSTFTWENGSMTMEYNYHFDGSKLIAEPKGSGQKLTLERE